MIDHFHSSSNDVKVLTGVRSSTVLVVSADRTARCDLRSRRAVECSGEFDLDGSAHTSVHSDPGVSDAAINKAMLYTTLIWESDMCSMKHGLVPGYNKYRKSQTHNLTSASHATQRG